MFWTLFLSLLVVWCEGVTSQSVVSQPPSASVNLGNTVKLACTLSNGVNIGSYRIHWLQQKPPNSPRFLLHFYTDSNKGQGSGVPSRFSGSKEASTNAGYLTISGVLDEDEAVYYCGIWYSNGYIFGGGTQMTVLGQPTVSPSVQVFAPSQEEISSPNPYTVVCLLTGFYPPAFNLQWKWGENVIRSGVETTKASKQGDKYLASSYLKLTAAEYEKYDTYTCEVTHENKKISKTAQKPGNC
uniref:Ig-like domain-containing protein n=1 Tax=Laticauda laticaudata TaxID=8630 RepID=A0A8C5S7D6_LATLA